MGTLNLLKKKIQELPFEKISQVTNNDDLYFVNKKSKKYILNIDSIKTHKFIYVKECLLTILIA